MDDTQPKKILLATGIFPPEEGGPATYSKLFQDKMPAFGFEVMVYPFQTVRHFPKLLRHFVYFLKLWRAAFRADIVYAQDTVSVGFPALCVAKFSGRKFLIRVPGDYAWEQAVGRFGVMDPIDEFQDKKYGFRVELLRFIQKFVVSHADLVITPSTYFRDVVSNWVTDKEKVVTVYNGIDFSAIPGPVSTYERQTIISAGRLIPNKGFAELVNLMTTLPAWELYIAGGGPYKEKLQERIKKHNVGDRVHLLGTLPRASLFKKIQQSEIFVLNTSFESFSFQIVEVMRLGVPIITTCAGALPELIEHEKEGILVFPNDINAIREAIERISENPAYRNSLTKAAFQKTELFSIDKTMEETVAIFKKLLHSTH